MLERHLVGTSAKVGIGKNRVEVAASIIKKFGHINSLSLLDGDRSEVHSGTEKVGVVILDDGMQVNYDRTN
jgi:hypothetical protein